MILNSFETLHDQVWCLKAQELATRMPSQFRAVAQTMTLGELARALYVEFNKAPHPPGGTQGFIVTIPEILAMIRDHALENNMEIYRHNSAVQANGIYCATRAIYMGAFALVLGMRFEFTGFHPTPQHEGHVWIAVSGQSSPLDVDSSTKDGRPLPEYIQRRTSHGFIGKRLFRP